MPSWSENITKAANDLIKRHGTTGPRKIRGYNSNNRYIRENDLSFDLKTDQVGETYGTRDVLRTSKKALAHNKVIFQTYCELLQRKLGRSPNVQDIANFTAVVLLLPPEVTSKGKPQTQQTQQTQQCEEVATVEGGAAAALEVDVREEEVDDEEQIRQKIGEGTGLDDWESWEVEVVVEE